MKARLTKRLIDALKPGCPPVWDTELQRFGVRVTPKGHRSYFIQYRSRRRSRKYTLGECKLFTPTEAREKAMKLLAGVAEGKGADARSELLKAATVADLAELYTRDYVPKKKERSGTEDCRLLDKLILPALGRHLVQSVTRADISRFHTAQGVTQGNPVQANRCLGLLKTMFNLAEDWGLLPEYSRNPCRRVKPFPEVSRDRVLSVAEMGRLGDQLDRAETADPALVAAMWLLLFTGCRKGEILRLRWAEVDPELRVLNLADTKSGARKVDLNVFARAVLKGLEQTGVWCFPRPTDPSKPLTDSSLWHFWTRVRKATGLEDVWIHDARRTYGSMVANSGASLHQVGGLMGHTSTAATQIYARLSDNPQRELAEQTGAAMAAALKQTPLAPVVAIRGA